MPTSSTSIKLNGTKCKTSTVFRGTNKNSYWPNKMAASRIQQQASGKSSLSSSISKYDPPTTLTSHQSQTPTEKLIGAQISPPCSLTSTSVTLRSSLLAASNVRLAPDGSAESTESGAAPASATITKISAPDIYTPSQSDKRQLSGSKWANLAGKSLMVGGGETGASRGSLASSTVRLTQRNGSPPTARRLDLRFVKSLIIALMAVDLAITILVYHYAQNDELKLWLTNYRLRFSLINLLLSAVWFMILAGGVLFNVYSILVASLLVNGASFLLLLGLSAVHFSRRLDYNAVQLAKLLALLFSVILLHLYLLLSMALTLHLAMAVRRNQRQAKT